MSASANKKLMQDIFAAAANPDPAARDRALFTASLAEDAKWVVTGQYSWSSTFSGKQAILNDLHGYVRTRLVDRTRTEAHRFIADGDIVVVDIGGPYEPGYNSDSTRTYSIGQPSEEMAQRYSVLQRAQQAAVAAVRPGITAEQVDAVARDVLAEAGLADAFVHRTGHGIGLSVHEEPYIVAGNDLPLVEGMAFSVEPGIYFPGEWGARIEDIVIVTAEGAEAMNSRPHELIVVPAGAESTS